MANVMKFYKTHLFVLLFHKEFNEIAKNVKETQV